MHVLVYLEIERAKQVTKSAWEEGGWGVGLKSKALETFCNYALSIFNLRPFPTILRGLEKDHFCTYKDNGS